MAYLMTRSGGSRWPEPVESRERRAPGERRPRRNPAAKLLVTGAVVGLGYLAWTYLGPDLKRYIKIHNM
jgi:hypothetical protein